MDDSDGYRSVSRRTLLRASAGIATVSVVGAGQASATERVSIDGFGGACPDATLEPSMGHCVDGGMDGCADDHPATVELQAAVQETLEERYPDVGSLIEAGFKPYFDTLDWDADGWSHWINPEYVGDDAVLDPERPESVLVDNETWRSIGVMFIATRDGEPIEPPAVYDDDGDRCSPWHYHAGLPGRFAWWYYRQAYERDFETGDVSLPCRTPCMLHVWTVDHPEGVYAHDGPPREYRDGEPADDPGFETDAEPGTDELDWDTLPENLVPEQRPDELAALVPGL
ncbi:hypothetical protein [Natronorubrum sulfidifaciens]|uniref:Uncharacterized protein n=1 Tax=Natronorubrum sulfidifaciens JCM 14089 TaxID=1230460 RepID=L9WDQ5_9EURY|nr:hypothetical protein [Natronorubrum sulfidifaciens]ELY47620.1 hypothetical protein C495_05162 [Natronorubrum sulfidifaciens JCM 14089]